MAFQINFRKIFILFIFISSILLCGESHSQNLVQKFDGINFSTGGNNSFAPFNGGQNNARYQFVDIDGDNDLDLFTFDTDTSLYFYKNTGTAQNASYKLVSTKFQNLYFKNWFYFVDIDNDNDYDLFTGGEFQSVKYYKNTGTQFNAAYQLITEELHTNSDSIIYSETNCVPVFCDIDGDGDKDFFTGQSLGTIIYYQNIGTPSNFSFKFITDFWQNLLIISPAFDNERHGANSLEFVDIDNDNDFDLFWGDLFSKGIYFIKNNGTPQSPNVAIVDSTYPHNSPYISQGYNSVRFADIDADGDKDMFVSVLYSSQNSKNFTFYKNNGTATTAFFQRNTDNYLNNIDVGGNSNISFTDIDNDGDKDLIIGNDIPVKLSLYLNTGTVSNPSFSLALDSIPIRSAQYNYNYAPSFADIDNDGDKDLFLGSYIKDSIWFFRNTGTPENYNFTYSGTGKQNGIDSIGQSSTPVFVDIDNDGDLDFFAGASNGRIFYYENTGTNQVFHFTLRTAYFNSIDVGDDAVPRFFDIDGDQDFDLFIGRQDGKISFYRNTGTVNTPVFILETNEYKSINNMQNSCPEFVDIDNDTDPDLFIGNVKGGLYYMENTLFSGIENSNSVLPDKFILYQNYPNPFNPSTRINYELIKSGIVSLSVYDILGNKIATLVNKYQNSGSYSVNFNAESPEFRTTLPSGIYFYRLTADDFTVNKRMLFIK
jgi:hypothetical protein